MTISNTDPSDSGRYMALMADMETGRDEPEPHAMMRAAQAEADVLYATALKAEPAAIADKLLNYSDAVTDTDMRAAMRVAAVMLLQFAVTRAAPKVISESAAVQAMAGVGVNPHRE